MSEHEKAPQPIPETKLIADYDNIVGRSWAERAKGNSEAADAILRAAGIAPPLPGDGR